MGLTRRQALQATAVGVTAVVGSQPASALGDDERVLIHPDGPLTEAIAGLEALEGGVRLEYDNFDFLAATVPASVRDELEADSRIALVEDDPRVDLQTGAGGGHHHRRIDLIDDVTGPIDDGLVGDDGLIGGGGGDCTVHPPERPSWGWERIGADEVEETGDSVDIAILDTGIETAHCDLEVAGGYNATGMPGDYEDRHGHGTHCAGIAGALENDIGVVGVAPEANCYAVKVLDDDGQGYHSWLAAGIDWCLSNDIEIASLSVGGTESTDAMDTAIEAAAAAGHLVIGAAGNEGNSGGESCGADNVTYPATHDDVLAVAATDDDDSLAAYSSVGEAVGLVAPGSSISSTDIGNDYATRSGTSMACPHVAGVAGLVWAQYDADGPGPGADVRAILEDSAESMTDACWDGHGLVDATAAIESATERDSDGARDDASDSGASTDGSASLWSRVRTAIAQLLEWLFG
ncbi:peptidase S8 [Salinadaptatus halalkaliphilus]|uniref:Peptidase S8 n=1 Tax=Salinadaptatus halalkaliphilus TaxID=2419781 RepID=A0A4S3TPC9_9EURY|nr:S8 family peptidase [Salinadaptatus halalkaliphilus]THE65073.1 peptidase S8 [Salinadaptatus halalkaliphilus]